MKHFLILASLLGCLCLSSCQCSNKPPVGPVEDQAQAVMPSVGATVLPA